MSTKTTRCGYISIIGSPNVGKSTLLNNALGIKISITSAKPQTTRHQILGVKTLESDQLIFVDTPGLHKKAKTKLNRSLNKAATRTLQEVDVIVWVVDCKRWDKDDDWVTELLSQVKAPVILAINKIDRLKDRQALLPMIAQMQQKYPFKAIVPLSALKGSQVSALESEIIKYLPESPFFFTEGEVSDRSDQFIASEIVREKLMRVLEEELPYALTVTIEAFEEEKDIVRLSAVIWVDRDSHKPIIIGKGGDQLRKIGKLARNDLEQYFHNKVYLQLWVKVKAGWSDDEKSLRQFGYDD